MLLRIQLLNSDIMHNMTVPLIKVYRSFMLMQWQNTMSIWVRLPPTAALLAFGIIVHVYISPTCELNVFCSNLLLLYANILLFAFPFYNSYYAKIYAGKIDLRIPIMITSLNKGPQLFRCDCMIAS